MTSIILILIGTLVAPWSLTLTLKSFLISDDDFFLIQKNLYAHDSSSQGNILDIVLTNNDFLVKDVLV